MNKKWLYLFMLVVLKGNNALIICEIVNALMNNKVLAENTFDECFFYDKKKWLIHCDSRQTIANAINKIFFILKKKAITSVYHIIRLCVFIIHRIEPVSSKEKRPKIMKQIKIINTLKKNRFWLNYLNYKFVIGFKLLLIFWGELECISI